MSDDDQTNDSTSPGPRVAAAKKKATRKKKAQLGHRRSQESGAPRGAGRGEIG